MTLGDAKKLYQQELADLYPPQECDSIFQLIAEDVGYSLLQILTNQNETIPEKDRKYFCETLLHLKKAEPVQYVCGKAEFYGLMLSVTPDVLIPRPETEELVDLILRNHSVFSGNILDIGTGSGCIAISLAKNLRNAHVSALDVSENALTVARKNAQNLHAGITFLHGDMQDEAFMSRLGMFEIIVSNPPYVCNAEKAEMRANVLQHEPHLALFVDDDANPLQFYEAIARFARTHLVEGGCVYCEINESFGEETKKLFESYHFSNRKIIKDIFGKDRIFTCEKIGQ